MNQDLKKAKQQANQTEVEMQIGKNGVTDGTIAELKKRLEHHDVVKIRLLKACEAKPQLVAEDLSKALGAQILSQKGQTIALYKKGQNKSFESKKG